jgi:hypothetical protein
VTAEKGNAISPRNRLLHENPEKCEPRMPERSSLCQAIELLIPHDSLFLQDELLNPLACTHLACIHVPLRIDS